MISSSTVPRDHNTRYVASLDGGGIRGIVSASILQALTDQASLQVPQAFDLVAGTSTGSLVAAATLMPDPANPTVPLYTAAKVVDFMVNKGPLVFHNSLWHKFTSGDGVITAKYSSAGLQSVITSLGDDYLSNMMTECCFPSTLKNNLGDFSFTRRKARTNADWKTLKLSQVLGCTTAAPYYFSASVLNLGKETDALMDGGMYANNPSINAICEAKELFGCSDNQICISIGTGFKKYSYNPAKSGNEGLLYVAPWIIDGCILPNETASMTMARQCLGNRFFRFDLELTNDSLDDVSPKNIAYLQDAVKAYLDHEKVQDSIREVAKLLKEKAPGEKPGGTLEAYS